MSSKSASVSTTIYTNIYTTMQIPIDLTNPTDLTQTCINNIQKNRCSMCNIKLNITNSILCKCEQLLCYKHRYYNEHKCTFDYKTAEREILARTNIKIENPKINKI